MIRHIKLRHWKLLTHNHILFLFFYLMAKKSTGYQTRTEQCKLACWLLGSGESFFALDSKSRKNVVANTRSAGIGLLLDTRSLHIRKEKCNVQSVKYKVRSPFN